MRKALIVPAWIIGLVLSYIALILVVAYLPELKAAIPVYRNVTRDVGQTRIRMAEIEDIEEVDVLFIGSSHTYRSFDPRVFDNHGISSYILGSVAQTPMNTYYLLERYIDQVDAKLLILETYWSVAEREGAESTIDLASHMQLSTENIKMAFASKDWTALNTVFIEYASQKIDDNYDKGSIDKEQYDFDKIDYVEGGYSGLYSTQRVPLSEIEGNERTVKLKDTQMEYVEKIVKLAIDNDVEIMFVRTPVTTELLTSVTNYQYSVDAYQEIADRYDVMFIDFNEQEHRDILNLDSVDHFYDPNHLNRYGAKIFSEYFAPYLKDELARGGI